MIGHYDALSVAVGGTGYFLSEREPVEHLTIEWFADRHPCDGAL